MGSLLAVGIAFFDAAPNGADHLSIGHSYKDCAPTELVIRSAQSWAKKDLAFFSSPPDFATANVKDFKGFGFRRVWNPLEQSDLP